MRGRGAAGILDLGALPAQHQPAGAGARDEGVDERRLKIPAADRDLRPVIAGGTPERLLVDELAETVEEHRLRSEHAARGERLLEPERRQLLNRMRQQVDADAQRLDLGGGLVDAAGDARLRQHQAESKAPAAPAEES